MLVTENIGLNIENKSVILSVKGYMLQSFKNYLIKEFERIENKIGVNHLLRTEILNIDYYDYEEKRKINFDILEIEIELNQKFYHNEIDFNVKNINHGHEENRHYYNELTYSELIIDFIDIKRSVEEFLNFFCKDIFKKLNYNFTVEESKKFYYREILKDYDKYLEYHG